MALSATIEGGVGGPTGAAKGDGQKDTGYVDFATTKGRPNPFLLREQTGSETTSDWQGREVVIKERMNSFPPELVRDFSTSLKKQIFRLMDIHQQRPEVFNRLMQEPYYRPYRDMYEKYVNVKDGSDAVGGHAMSVFDEKSFKEYMDTDAGFETAVELRSIKLQSMAENAGTFLDMNLDTPAPDSIDTQTVNTGRGGSLHEVQRRMRHFFADTLKTHERDTPVAGVITTKGRAAASIALLSATLGSAGLLAGPAMAAAGALASPALAGIFHSFQQGERVTVQQVNDALTIAQDADPVRREWAREMYNVDIHNMEIQNGQVVIRQDIRNNTALANPAKYVETVRDELVRDNQQIIKAQEAMGVARALRKGMDVVGLPGRQQQFAQRDIPFEVQVQTEFLRSPQLVDNAGHTCQIQNAQNEWVINPNFDWQNTDEIAAYNLRREIYSRLLSEKINRDFEDIAEWGKDHKAGLIADIAKARERAPLNHNQRLAEIGTQDERLTADQAFLAGEVAPFATVTEDLRGIADSRRAAEQARRNVTRVSNHPTGSTNEVDLLNYVLNDVPVGGAPAFDVDVMHNNKRMRITSIAGREQTALQEYQAAVGAIPAAAQAAGRAAESVATGLLNAADKVLAAAMVPINQDKDAVNAALKSIEDAETAVNSAFNVFNTRDAELEAVRNTTTQMADARRSIEGWSHGRGGARIDLSLRALQTADFDELMDRIVRVNGATGNGWAETERNNPDNRQLLLNAMAEARAVVIEPRLDAPSINFQAAVDPARYNFSEQELITLSEQAIDDRVRALIRGGARLPIPTRDVIRNVKSEAQARLNSRLRAMREVDRNIAGRRTILERQRERLGTEGEATPEIDTIARAANRIDDIRRTMEMPVNQFLARLDIAQASTQPDHYSAEEQDNNHSIAYANIMEWIFNHRDDTRAAHDGVTGSGAAFTRNSNFLDEDTLRDLLNEGFGLVAPAGGVGAPATFEESIDMVGRLVQAGDLTRAQFGRFLTENVVFGYMHPRVQTI